MSLVNLSHVCSHLQNASLARLGLTSIPYTRLHLSLSLLLHKQGFLSQVKLAGASPPASCFPPGADGHYITSHPHSERGQRTPEAALQWIAKNGASSSVESLRQQGFGQSAIEYAISRREKDKAQLQRDGYGVTAAEFLLRHGFKTVEQMEESDLSAEQIATVQHCLPIIDECRTAALDEVNAKYGTQSRAEYEEREQEAAGLEDRDVKSYDKRFRDYLMERIYRADYDVETLRFFAGDQRFRTTRELELDGVEVEAMGLTIPNQPFATPAPEYAADPLQLEEEGVVTQANRASRRLWLGLKYWDGLPVLRKARMLSKPTKRIIMSEYELSKLIRGRNAGEVKPLTQVGEIMVVNTKMGIMEIRECVERKLGGMVLCRVW